MLVSAVSFGEIRADLPTHQVCVSRFDWENFPLRFKGSKHVDEKAFYSYLVENICPDVISALRVGSLLHATAASL